MHTISSCLQGHNLPGHTIYTIKCGLQKKIHLQDHTTFTINFCLQGHTFARTYNVYKQFHLTRQTIYITNFLPAVAYICKILSIPACKDILQGRTMYIINFCLQMHTFERVDNIDHKYRTAKANAYKDILSVPAG